MPDTPYLVRKKWSRAWSQLFSQKYYQALWANYHTTWISELLPETATAKVTQLRRSGQQGISRESSHMFHPRRVIISIHCHSTIINHSWAISGRNYICSPSLESSNQGMGQYGNYWSRVWDETAALVLSSLVKRCKYQKSEILVECLWQLQAIWVLQVSYLSLLNMSSCL